MWKKIKLSTEINYLETKNQKDNLKLYLNINIYLNNLYI